jgi:hypothetical protein
MKSDGLDGGIRDVYHGIGRSVMGNTGSADSPEESVQGISCFSGRETRNLP